MKYDKNVRQFTWVLRALSFCLVFAILTGKLTYWLLVTDIFLLICATFLIGYLAALRSLKKFIFKSGVKVGSNAEK